MGSARDDAEPVPVIGGAAVRPGMLPALDEYPEDAVLGPDREIVTPAPGWVLVSGSVGVVAVVVGCFLLFWLGMGTAVRESAVEAFGVAFSLMLVVAIVGVFWQSAHDRRRARRASRRTS